MFRNALLGAVCLMAVVATGYAASPAAQEKPVVKVVQPALTPLVYPRSLTGVVVPLSQAQVGFQVAGKIAQRAVKTGQVVKAGQLLMALDDADYRLQVAQVEAEIRATQSDYETAQRDLKRYQDLLKRRLASQQQVDAAQNAVTKLKAQLAALKPKLAQAQNQLRYTKLYAPEAGMVQAYLVDVGQVVGAGTPVVQLIYQKGQAVEVAWPETWGVPAEQVRVAVRGKQYMATRYEQAAMANVASRTLKVRYRMPASTPALWGRTAQVSVEQQAESVWKVPASALQMAHGKTYVLVVQKGEVVRQPVDVVRMGDGVAWVKGALTPQMQLVAMGVHVLRPGMQVRVIRDE